MGGGEDKLRGCVAVGERCLERGGYGKGGGDAGNDLEGDVGSAKGLDLFGSTAEDERIAGLEAQDGASGEGVVEHQVVDAGLVDAGLTAALADRDDLSSGAGEREDLVRDEVIGEDDVRGLEQGVRAQGEEIGCTGTGSGEVDDSGLRGMDHSSACWVRGRGLVRACSRA